MGSKQNYASVVAEVTSGALHVLLDRAAELGIEVTPAQVANLVPNLAQVASDLLTYANSHNGSVNGAEIALLSTAEAGTEDQDGSDMQTETQPAAQQLMETGSTTQLQLFDDDCDGS